MGLDSKTNEFNETIFYKNDSELTYQIKALEKLNSEYPNNENIKNELKKCKASIKNESRIESKLMDSKIGMYVIRDLNLLYKDIKAQIDFVVITQGFIYVLECKNLFGNIIINEDGEFFKKTKKDERIILEEIESPIKVAEKYKNILKKIWSSKISSKDKMKFENAFERSYKTVLVISNPKTVVSCKNAPKEIKNKIIKADELVDFIKNDLKKFQTRKELIDSKDEMHGQAYRLVDFHVDHNDNWEEKYKKRFKLKSNDEKEIKKKKTAIKKVKLKQKKSPKPVEKVSSKKKTNVVKKENTNIKKLDRVSQIKTMMEANEISNSYYTSLKKKLEKYRIAKSKQNQVPDYYVFTDEELDKLVNKLPRTVDEITRRKLLTPVKTKMFGADIVKIINSK